MINESSKPKRIEVLAELKRAVKETDLIVSALAGTTNETYGVIDRPGNLYLVGMGMVSQVALGLATALPQCRVFAFDTDGSILLAPSILPVVGTCQPKNLYIVVFDNERLYGSRGGPKSQTGTGTNIGGIAKACGMEMVRTLNDRALLRSEIDAFLGSEGPAMLVVKIQALQRAFVGPFMDGKEIKYKFVRHVERVAQTEILVPKQ
jgi:thiamine pyrophosphate-dependent acetolactate synthase large subunit-like protein